MSGRRKLVEEMTYLYKAMEYCQDDYEKQLYLKKRVREIKEILKRERFKNILKTEMIVRNKNEKK